MKRSYSNKKIATAFKKPRYVRPVSNNRDNNSDVQPTGVVGGYKNIRSRSKPNFSKKLARQIVNASAEKKYYTVTSTQVVDNASGTSCVKCSAVPQGDIDQSRDGDQLTIRSIEFAFTAQLLVASLATNTLVQNLRVILFQWLMTDNGASPTIASILDTTAGLGTLWQAGYNHDNRFNFKILYDERFNLTQQSNVACSGSEQHLARAMITTGFRYGNKIQYVAGGTNGTGNLYYFAVSDIPAAQAANTKANVITYTKLNFSDC